MRTAFSLIVFAAWILFSFFVLTPPTAAAANHSTRTINDSLVQNLECRNLSINKIYSSIREDAFDVSRNMPIKNWGFKSGLANIAGCWSLSRTQRMMSYLARYNTSSDKRIETRVPPLLNMIRGATLVPWRLLAQESANEDILKLEDSEEAEFEYNEDAEFAANNVNPNSIKNYCEKRLHNYQVFEVEDSNFLESKNNPGPSLWKALHIGYDQYFRGKKVPRNFREEIQAQQARLFFRIKNLKMIWKKGARSERRNYETAKRLTKNLAGKRLTLLNLRMDRTRQHVVMAKSYKKISPELYEFKVYDSNAPNTDPSVFYNNHRQVFYAPEILSRFKDKKPYRSLGAFIVDEEDRGMLEVAMLNHYREICKNP